MKKILTLLCLVSVATSFGQSLRLYNGATDITNTTFTVPVSGGIMQENDIDIHNITSSSVTFKIKRTILNAPLDTTCSVYFCSGISCYPPSTNVNYTEPGSGTTLAGMTNLTGATGLLAHYDLGAACYEAYIRYEAYKVGVLGDTTTTIIHYVCTTGVDDIEKTGGTISNAYPNPASSAVSIKYNVKEYSTKGKIVFYDMLGKTVKEIILNDKEGIARINIADLNVGIYFYTFLVDDKAITTKKLVISSK